MKIETTPQENHQVKVQVELEQEQMDSARRRAARRIAGRTRIPGFRPGKAPYEVIVRQVGEGAVSEEAVELLMEEVYPQVLKEADLKPGAPGSLEEVVSLDPPKFTFTVPLEPVVDLGNYRAIRHPYDWQKPGEDKVDESIEELRRMYASTETAERPVQEDDYVLVDIRGVSRADPQGEPLISRPGYPVHIDKEINDKEWPFPGFARQLIGAAAGDTRRLSHIFPEDHTDEKLKGQEVDLDAAVKTVRAVRLPELNDEFAKTVGSFESLSALRDVARANLEQRSKAEYDDIWFEQVLDKIKEKATLKYPPQVVDHEVEHVLEDLNQRLAGQGLDLDAYVKSQGTDREKFIAEEVRPAAIKRLERSLLLEELSKAEKIELKEEDLNASFQETWMEVQSSAGFQKSMKGAKTPPKRVVDAVAMESAGRAYTRLTLDRIKEIATGQAGKAVDKAPAGDSAPQSESPTKKKKPAAAAKTPGRAAPGKQADGKTKEEK